MKKIAAGWANPFHEIVQSIPPTEEPKQIILEDWVPPSQGWTNAPGSDYVVLVGDAAHAMTMYRGEALNHGILDVETLLTDILPAAKKNGDAGENAFRSGCEKYTESMVERTAPAVLRSRQACLDAHVFERINDSSPLIQMRIAKLQETQANLATPA
jgi:2-polyprenyl-6-methoxyphenol hydroxylase-like FAD-dependent oxidoreductase